MRSPERGSGPVKVGAPMLDVGAGLSSAPGCRGLHRAPADGVGRLVSSSLLEFALASLGTLAASVMASGAFPACSARTRRCSPPTAGSGDRDGWIVLAGAGWRCGGARAACSGDDLPGDQRLSNNARRVAHRDELTHEIEPCSPRGHAAHWLARTGRRACPPPTCRTCPVIAAGAVQGALGSVQELQHETAGAYRLIGPPLRVDQAALSYPSPAPAPIPAPCVWSGQGAARGDRGDRMTGEDGIADLRRARIAAGRDACRGAAGRSRARPAVIRRTIALAEIPAPTGAEKARDLVVGWWTHDGWASRVDAAGNVWAQVADGPGAGLLVCAHLDTVFPETTSAVVR